MTTRTPRRSPPETAVAVIDPKDAYTAIEAAIESRRDQITQTLTAGINPDRFLKVALQAITRQPKLLQCTPASIVLSLRDAAELGVEPSGLLGSAYLVPYRRNFKVGDTWHSEMNAQLIVGYRGLIELARRSGEIADLEARVVRERDDLDIEYGSRGHVFHRPYIGPEDPGTYLGGYMRAKLRNGEEHVEWMSVAEIDAVRKRSKAADDGPWITDWPEMAKKTVTRRGLKYLPLSVNVQRAMELEDAAETVAAMPTAQVSSAARTRLLARATPVEVVETAHNGEEQAPLSEEAPSGSEAHIEVAEATAGVSEAQRPLCLEPSPYGDGTFCDKPPQHKGNHHSEGGTW